MEEEKFNKLISSINSGKYDQKQLAKLYNNAMRVNTITESQREQIIVDIEKVTRLNFPSAAKKLFGAKDIEAREILSKLYSQISSKYDISVNRLKNGVKTGGGMISGKYYIEIYMSYKNINNHGSFLTLQQKSVDSELKALIGHYKTGGSETGVINEEELGVELPELLFEKYAVFLEMVIL